MTEHVQRYPLRRWQELADRSPPAISDSVGRSTDGRVLLNGRPAGTHDRRILAAALRMAGQAARRAEPAIVGATSTGWAGQQQSSADESRPTRAVAARPTKRTG